MNFHITQPLDLSLNCAILDVASRAIPGGFEIAEEAPGSWQELKAHLDAGKRLVVYSGGSETTIYIDPSVNYAFRAWHDYTHWINDLDFTLDGEIGVCDEQCRVLAAMAVDETQAANWSRIIRAEVIGQKLYHRLYDRFPEDQRGFVTAFLRQPDLALSAHW